MPAAPRRTEVNTYLHSSQISEIGHFLSCSVQASLFLISILLLLLAPLISIYLFTVNVFKTLYIENEMTWAFV